MAGIVVGATVAMFVALLGTPLLARFLKVHGVGQPIHDAVTQHSHKAGTPTMGGAILTIALLTGYVAARLVVGEGPTSTGLLVLAVAAAAAIIGGLDDWLKVRSRRNIGGLSRRAKTALQAPVIVGFCLAHVAAGSCHSISFTRCAAGIELRPVVWVVFAAAFLWATMNAVNFADGVEGLLGGFGAVTCLALLLIAFWQFRHPSDYGIPNPLDLAVIAACLAAACCGFLWWNVNPMTIFMGDIGSLALGAAIAALALSMNVTMLIAVLGVVYVVEFASVGLQIYTWKWYFKPRGASRRLFRMAPIHHHFEMVGWSDGTILIRFWIMNGLAAAVALAVFYADALAID